MTTKPEWAIGLTQEDYDYLLHQLWYDCEVAGEASAIDLANRLKACRSSAIIHGVFEPTDKKSD